MKNKTPPAGTHFYKKAGLTKPILVHVSKAIHAKLMKLADKEERSLQVTVRRILEERLRKLI